MQMDGGLSIQSRCLGRDSMWETQACMGREVYAGRWACGERCRQEHAIIRWTGVLCGRTDILWLWDDRRRQGPAIWLRSMLVWSDTVLDEIDFGKVVQQGQAECREVDSRAYNTIIAFSNEVKWLVQRALQPIHHSGNIQTRLSPSVTSLFNTR